MTTVAGTLAGPDDTCGLYSHIGSRNRGGNSIEKRLAEVPHQGMQSIGSDIVRAPVSADAFAGAILALLTTPQPSAGIDHLAAEGACSWAEFAAEAFALFGVHLPGCRRRSKGRLPPHSAARLFGFGQHLRPRHRHQAAALERRLGGISAQAANLWTHTVEGADITTSMTDNVIAPLQRI
jgi:hypothetical protein